MEKLYEIIYKALLFLYQLHNIITIDIDALNYLVAHPEECHIFEEGEED